jgi:hypothetical protein
MWSERLTPRQFYSQVKSPQYPLNRRLGGPRSRYVRSCSWQQSTASKQRWPIVACWPGESPVAGLWRSWLHSEGLRFQPYMSASQMNVRQQSYILPPVKLATHRHVLRSSIPEGLQQLAWLILGVRRIGDQSYFSFFFRGLFNDAYSIETINRQMVGW